MKPISFIIIDRETIKINLSKDSNMYRFLADFIFSCE